MDRIGLRVTRFVAVTTRADAAFLQLVIALVVSIVAPRLLEVLSSACACASAARRDKIDVDAR